MRNTRLPLIRAILLAAALISPIRAQIDTGGITGTVKDPSGAMVPGASLTLKNEATGVSQKTRSTTTGNYVFEAVPTGSYSLTVEASGFKTYLATGIEIHVQAVITADVALEVGGAAQTVTVIPEATMLQAEDASLGQTVSSESMNDMPLNGRNWISLATLASGSYLTGGTNTTSLFVNGAEPGQVDYRVSGVNNNEEVFGGYSVAPAPDAVEEFKLQDGNNSAEFGHSVGAVVNAVLKSGTNRLRGNLWEYLRNEALNANDFISNANGTKRQEYRQNQFGGTIGGPVYLPKLYTGKNRTFFFFDYQRTQRLVPVTFTDNVPTAPMHSSNFTNLQDLISGNSGTETDALGRIFPHGTVFDPATTRALPAGAQDPITGLVNTKTSTIYVRDPFFAGNLTGITNFTGLVPQLNLIPASRIDANAVKILQLLPLPVHPGLQNNFFSSQPQQTNSNQYDIRIDENISTKDAVFGVLSRQTTNQSAAQPFPVVDSALQTQFATTQPVYVLALSETHLFSPTVVNEARVGLNHNFNTRLDPDAYTANLPQQYGIEGIPQVSGNGGIPTFNINGFSAFGSRRFQPTIQTTEAQNYTDNLSVIRGSHQLKMGIQINHIVGDIIQPAYSRGNLTYNGQYSDIPNQNSGLVGLADFLLAPAASSINPSLGLTTYDSLGGMSGYNASNYAGTNYSMLYSGAYFQDNWKVTPNLTLNLGLRYDYFPPYGESDGRQGNLVLTNGNSASGTYYIPKQTCNSPRNSAFDTLLNGDNIQIDCLPGLAVNKTQKTNFAPRVGIAYRLKPRLVVRAGYAISYGAVDSVGYGGTLGTNYPFQYTLNGPSTTSLVPTILPNGQTATMENLFASVNVQDPTQLQVASVGLGLSGKQYEYLTPYVESMNFTLQYQFSARDVFQVGYVQTSGRHLDTLGQQNVPTELLPTAVNSTNYRPLPNLSTSQLLSSGTESNYRSLQAVYAHRFRAGLTFNANYTFGKCMSDEAGKTGMGPSYRAQWLYGFGVHGDYTLCGADAKQAAHLWGQYGLPFGQGRTLLRNAHGLLNALVGGWNFNYIYIYQSGQPFTVGCPVGTSSDFGCNAFMIPGVNPYAGPHNQNQWLNPAAFAQPPATTQVGQTNFAPLGGAANQLRGPSLKNLDASLLKRFRVTESNQVEFRAEAFNLSNSVDFSNPGQLNFTNLKAFSSITGTRNNQRLVQLALKLFW
ncbi:MAG TPA: TonB-dependent receptor [Bryobacteraceae bacterium]|nr:TonB-dependent receptor [Bryobacteraceae bacterium]